jgi:hypothetical protein
MAVRGAAAALAGGRDALLTLVRHFLKQFASFESISPWGEPKHAVIAVVSLLAAPGYLMAVVTVRSTYGTARVEAAAFPPHLWLWAQEWHLLTVSLSAAAVLVAVQWRAFVLSGRDYRILGVLPLERRVVTAAKLASVAVIVLLLHAGLNALPGLILPVASPLGYLRPALALQATLLIQTTFVCAAVVAAQGLLGLALPRAIVPRASSLLQFAILLGAAWLCVFQASLSRFAYSVRDSVFHPLNALLPVVWFRSLYVRLAGVASPQIDAQALQALVATALALAVALPCCLAGYRDSDGEAVARRRWRWPAAVRLPSTLRRWLPSRRSPAQGVASFVRRAAVASPGVALIARAWLALGVAITLGGLGALVLRHYGRDAPLLPSAPLHAPAIVLPFFALVGLRLAAAFPATLEANWIFRLTETPRSADYAEGVRAAAMRTAVWPVLGALGLPYAVLWGPWPALALLALAWAVGRLTVEWLFLGFAKVPFTCTYQPGKANLRVTWPKYAAIFLVYCAWLPALASWLLTRPLAYGIALLLLLGARKALVRAGERSLARSGRLLFDDRAPAFVTGLDLQA